MLLKALDFIRTLGWGIISFIYNLIDTLFDILRELNAYNIIDSVAENSMFSNFHKGIIAIAVTLLGLFALFKFVMKIIEPEEGPSVQQIVTEIIKSSLFQAHQIRFLLSDQKSISELFPKQLKKPFLLYIIITTYYRRLFPWHQSKSMLRNSSAPLCLCSSHAEPQPLRAAKAVRSTLLIS